MNYRNGEECLHATYEDMKDMTLEDAIFILSQSVTKYHEAETENQRINLPRPRLIKAYELVIEASKEYIRNNGKENANVYSISNKNKQYDYCGREI